MNSIPWTKPGDEYIFGWKCCSSKTKSHPGWFQTIETFAAQEKQMEVCEVCGAFLIVGDAQSRVDDHLMGKQHMGYAKIKSTVEELKVSP